MSPLCNRAAWDSLEGRIRAVTSAPSLGDSLTYEIRNRKSEKEEESLDEWIEVMEKVLPLSLITTKGGIESLISLCSTLIEGQKKRAQSRFQEYLGVALAGADAISGEVAYQGLWGSF